MGSAEIEGAAATSVVIVPPDNIMVRANPAASRMRLSSPLSSAPIALQSTATASISIRNSGWASALTATKVEAGIFLPKNSSRMAA
jgi:hypothetical protein